jgi:hypothetical protein
MVHGDLPNQCVGLAQVRHVRHSRDLHPGGLVWLETTLLEHFMQSERGIWQTENRGMSMALVLLNDVSQYLVRCRVKRMRQGHGAVGTADGAGIHGQQPARPFVTPIWGNCGHCGTLN